MRPFAAYRLTLGCCSPLKMEWGDQSVKLGSRGASRKSETQMKAGTVCGHSFLFPPMSLEYSKEKTAFQMMLTDPPSGHPGNGVCLNWGDVCSWRRLQSAQASSVTLLWEVSLSSPNATAAPYTGPHGLVQRPRASGVAETIATAMHLFLVFSR